MAIVIAVGIIGLVVLVLLVRYLATRGTPRTLLWAVLLILGVLLTLIVLSAATVYYVMPVGWIVALVACGAGLIALVVLTGRSLTWKPLPVLATVALLAGAVVLGTVMLMFVPSAPIGLLETRAQQIAEANGFTALLAPDEAMATWTGLPVNALPEADPGLSVEYERFLLQQRKADGPLTAEDLEALVAPGATPISGLQPIPADVTTSEQTVQGNPAIVAEYVDVPPEALDKPDEEGEATTVLAFGLDGVEVILRSTTWYDCDPVGECTENPPLTAENLVAIADTLEPDA